MLGDVVSRSRPARRAWWANALFELRPSNCRLDRCGIAGVEASRFDPVILRIVAAMIEVVDAAVAAQRVPGRSENGPSTS
jgi:hypothetical protein